MITAEGRAKMSAGGRMSGKKSKGRKLELITEAMRERGRQWGKKYGKINGGNHLTEAGLERLRKSGLASRKEIVVVFDGDCLIVVSHFIGKNGRVCIMRNRKNYGNVARLVWEQEVGSIPEGYVIHHRSTCKSNCVNIQHLKCIPKSVHDKIPSKWNPRLDIDEFVDVMGIAV